MRVSWRKNEYDKKKTTESCTYSELPFWFYIKWQTKKNTESFNVKYSYQNVISFNIFYSQHSHRDLTTSLGFSQSLSYIISNCSTYTSNTIIQTIFYIYNRDYRTIQKKDKIKLYFHICSITIIIYKFYIFHRSICICCHRKLVFIKNQTIHV